MYKSIVLLQITKIFLAPSQIAAVLSSSELYNTDLSTIKTVLTGGSIVSKELVERTNKLLLNGCVRNVYGMSEHGGIISLTYPIVKHGSVGLLYEGALAKIIDENNELCGVGEKGELLIYPRYPVLGYYRNKDATNETIDIDGWIHTGDVGYFDEDGHLFLVDRKKDIMKYKGFQVSPSEIENVILKLNGVSNVCVVEIPELTTDLPAALILRSDGDHKVTEEEVISIVRSKSLLTILCRRSIYKIFYVYRTMT